jgi:membrane-associated protein
MAAESFFDSQGKTAIILARFMPFVRTFAPIVAGIAAMRYKTFMQYNVVGGLLWGVGLTYLGYFLGKSIPENQIDT